MGGNYFDTRSFEAEINTRGMDTDVLQSPKTLRVLVVDDSILVRKQMVKILSSEGYIISGMSVDGIDGVEQYKRYYPDIDLVTMDLSMPRMDGVSALKQILEFDKNAKILVVSALGKQDLVEKALKAGAVNYIEKPLEKNKVIEKINRVFSLS